jgi:hypothetical protein
MSELEDRERGDDRLLRDLAALESLVDRRPGALTRLQRELGDPTARGLVASLAAAVQRPARREAHG